MHPYRRPSPPTSPTILIKPPSSSYQLQYGTSSTNPRVIIGASPTPSPPYTPPPPPPLPMEVPMTREIEYLSMQVNMLEQVIAGLMHQNQILSVSLAMLIHQNNGVSSTASMGLNEPRPGWYEHKN
ncbi:hypothetical protein HDU99_000513 [Rhizoclosmatium hyalinum]|nr:hypothetical protein HDU99_000513 [Rhizoclosmatium hyalinum]